MKIVNGDIIALAKDGHFDFIVHGCNCFHQMGAGLALQVSSQFPHVFAADKATECGDITKLGTYSGALVNIEHPFIVVNAYTQYQPGPNAEYAAIATFLRNFRAQYGKFKDIRIAFPEIGCGIGGLNIEPVKALIEDILGDMDVTLVIYEG
jgi:O-acetyl-ADP-ribose deacetylase (regulator of RNase III)